MPDPLDSFPSQIRQGDSVAVLVTLDDYPASTWTVTFYLSGPTAELSKAASASGDDHLLELSAAQTATLGVETIGWVAKAVSGSEVHTVLSGTAEVLADLATSGPIDSRTEAQKVLDAINASILGSATSDQQEYTIGSRSLKRMTMDEKLKLQALYEKKVALEKRTGQKNILVQFVGPS